MPNITMSMDEDLIRKARKIAVEKNTTMTAMVRSYLRKLVERENQKKERLVFTASATWAQYFSVRSSLGPSTMTRQTFCVPE